jgi:cytochrome c
MPGFGVERLLTVLIPAGTLAVLVGGPAVLAQSISGDPIAGEKLAREVCVTCHEVEKGQRGYSPEGAPAFLEVAHQATTTALSLKVFLRTPHEVMPDLILSDTETDDIIAYILSLK